MVFDCPFISSEEFLAAFNSILESIDSESDKQTQLFDGSDQQHIIHLYKLIVSQGLHKPVISGCNLSDICDALLTDWEESAPPSNTIQQLASLLSKPIIKTLFGTYDSVANQRYFPRLPDVPFEVDDDDGVAVKIVRLIRGNEPLGATIKCDATGAVFIARIIAGGVADRSACIQAISRILKVGDRLVEINNVPVNGMKPTDIVRLLNDGTGTVVFKLIPARIPTIIESGEKRYLYALADYSGHMDSLHPCPEAALSFKRGDVLELLVTADEHWWQARSFGSGAFAFSSQDSKDTPEKVGLIPSELLHSKILAQRDYEERAKFGKKTSRSSLEEKICFQRCDSLLYEPVCLAYPDPSIIRPIVLIGPSGIGRNELKRRLIMSNCDRFATTVPHTSRPPRPHEIPGVDYHFAKREDMEQWIVQGRFLEFGEYKGNIYGTLVDSVVDVIRKGRVPVLNPHPLALRILRTAEFRAFVIFIRPPKFEKLRETRQHRINNSHNQEDCHGNVANASGVANGSRVFTDSELEQMISAADQLYQIYGHLFDLVIVNENLDIAVKQLCQAVNKLDTSPTWVPASWME
uniref:MAGUK p55 subfamily member 7 n=1 Tax=Syphacia muris TaxID=451379 RepID=A0A0N5AJL0_9BILA